MAYKVISLTDARAMAEVLPPGPAGSVAVRARDADVPAVDRLQRPLRDLRISVTDRCNFRCSYCMPKAAFPKTHAFLPQSALLSFEEIEQVARAFVQLGVRKIRLTGGEPLLRRHVERLIERLSALRTTDGAPLDLTLTTNGSVLAAKAQALRDAGLQRVTVSLDALDDGVFRQLNDVDFPVADVLRGIDAALAAGLGPIKVNMVVKRGVNESQVLPMAQHFRGTGVALRFIEYMDVGGTNGWRLDEVVPSADIVAMVSAVHPLVRVAPGSAGETAERWQYRDSAGDGAGAGEIGVISSVTKAFCGDCNRARLSTEGKLYTCLFASQGHDLRALLRGDADAGQLTARLASIWSQRADRYSELRSASSLDARPPSRGQDNGRRVEMHYIGG